MTYEKRSRGVYITRPDSFNISETLTCGQVFRFSHTDSGFTLLAHGRMLCISEDENEIRFNYPRGDLSIEGFAEIWADYFDLNRDYTEIKKVLCRDDILKTAVDFAPGIRILRQEPWETLISFIISQNNRIPQIQKSISNLCRRYGTPIDEDCYAFPSPEQLANASIAELMECRVGFRARYIADATYKVLSGEIDLYTYDCPEQMKERLLSILGVGNKVADCIMLFAYGRYDYFPVDVWVRRVMSHYYFGGREAKLDEIQQLAKDKFAGYAGFAQQYLFHYARQTEIR